MIGPLETIGWMLAAIVKFLVTPSLMIGRGINLWPTVLITSIGGAFGVVLFFYFGKWLFRKWSDWTTGRSKKKFNFTPGRRRWVHFRHRFGLWGLLLISGLISVPIASVLAAKYYSKDGRMPWLLVLSFVAWALFLSTLSYWVLE